MADRVIIMQHESGPIVKAFWDTPRGREKKEEWIEVSPYDEEYLDTVVVKPS